MPRLPPVIRTTGRLDCMAFKAFPNIERLSLTRAPEGVNKTARENDHEHHRTHPCHRRRPRRLGSRLADRPGRRSGRPARDAPGARHRRPQDRRPCRARLLQLLPLGRCRDQRGRPAASGDAHASARSSWPRATPTRCRPAARSRSTATASPMPSRRRSKRIRSSPSSAARWPACRRRNGPPSSSPPAPSPRRPWPRRSSRSPARR